MFYIKNSLLLIFCSFTVGIIAQNTSLSGNISTFQEVPLSNVEVTIKSGEFSATTMTNEAGNYSFEDLPEDISISFELTTENNNPLNGVSTFDYVLAARHILGITPFEEAYQYLAMDVNQSGNITAFDLVLHRNLILGITAEFPQSSWRYIEKEELAALNFSQANDPEYESEVTANFNLTSGENTVINFIGIKKGDANGNATTN